MLKLIHQSAIKISIIHSQHSLPFLSIKMLYTKAPWYRLATQVISVRFPLGKWMNLCSGQPMPCEGNRVVSPKCWWDIDLQSVNNCKNGLLSLLQFNHRENRNTSSYLKGLCVRLLAKISHWKCVFNMKHI